MLSRYDIVSSAGAAEMNILASFCRFAGCPKVNGVPKVEVVLLPKAMFVWLKAQRQGEMACLSTDSCHSFMTPHMGQYHQELCHGQVSPFNFASAPEQDKRVAKN